MKHNHELDGKLHAGCGACDYIIELVPSAKRQAQADANAKLHAAKADRPKTRK